MRTEVRDTAKLGSAIILMFALLGTISAQFIKFPTPPAAPPVPKPATNAVLFAWDASPDPTAVGYRIHWGGKANSYTNSAAVGNTTNALLTEFPWGKTLFFAATAYNEYGEESDFSNEVEYTVPPPPQPLLSITPAVFALSWPALADVFYAVQYSTNLANTNWYTQATFMSGSNTTAVVLVTNDAPNKNWRIKL